jgi:hypothetical protein
MLLSRGEIILKLEELKRELNTYQKVLQVLDRSGLEKRTGPAMRFYRARPSAAIKIVLREKGAQPQEDLMKELEDGGIAVGRKRGMHNTRIAIEKTLRTGALKQVNGLVGLPEWSDDMFQQKKRPDPKT